MPDFPTNPKPDYPIEETPANPEILVSTHRDGSEQRRYKGAGERGTFKMKFGGSCPITKAQRDNLLNHWVNVHGTLDAFDWQHPERSGEHYMVRYMEAPTFELVAFNAYTGSVLLKVVPA